MSAEAAQQQPPPAPPGSKMQCPISAYGHKEDFAKIMKECKAESFWQRALPLSLGSVLVTQGLLYKGYLSPNKRFGIFPKLAYGMDGECWQVRNFVAGVLGFVVGKISYMGECQKKFERSGIQLGDAGFFPGFGAGFGPESRKHKHCHQTCVECKAKCAKEHGQNTQTTKTPAS